MYRWILVIGMGICSIICFAQMIRPDKGFESVTVGASSFFGSLFFNWLLKMSVRVKKREVFYLPQTGDKITYSDKSLAMFNDAYREFYSKEVYEVKYSFGNKDYNEIKLNAGTWFYTGEWKLLPKETPLRN